MAEVQKPQETLAAPVVDATPAVDAPAPAAAATETPADAGAPATEAAADAPADAPAAEEPAKKEEAKDEVTPATDGVLGYKGGSLMKALRFSKRYFWFSDEPVEAKQLSNYFQNEKPNVAHANAAWASQTGKGLLFFAKRAEDKASPAGIINLSEISDISKEGFNEFHFKANGHKLTFQAGTSGERASWIAALEAKAAEAKAEKDTIVGSEGYKAELEKLTKPPVVVAAASAAKKSTEDKAKEDKPETEAAPETKTKSRSQSRKRASIFGSFLGKKDEAEAKKEEKAEGKEEPKPEGEAAAPAAEASAAAAATETPAATEGVTEATPATEEPKPEEKKAEAPTKAKRSSIFGSLLHKVTNQDKEKDAAKTTETPAVSSTAPQLGDPVDRAASEPIQAEAVTSPETAEPAKEPAKEAEKPAASPSGSKGGLLGFIKKEIKSDEKKEAKAESKGEEAPADKKPEEPAASDEQPAAAETSTPTAGKERRRKSLFGTLGTKKENKAEGSESEPAEGEARSKSPASKLGGLFRRPSKANKEASKEKATTTAPAEGETIPEGGEKPEPLTKDEPAEPSAAVNGTEGEEKPADAAASSSQAVQATA